METSRHGPGATPEFLRLYIFGAGGSGREVAWLAKRRWGDQIELIFLVDKPEYLSDPVNGIPVRLVADAMSSSEHRFVAAIGDPSTRLKVVASCMNVGLLPATLIDPTVAISAHNHVDRGSIISAGAIVTTNVVVGSHVHINVGCTVSHDVRLGDYATLSPGVHVSDHVEIGANVFVGTGANVINGHADAPLVIGDGAVIAAGACVTRSVEPGALMAGVPALRKR